MSDNIPTYPKNNIGRELIPMKLVNKTGRANLYFYLVGTTDPDHSANQTYYLSDYNGDVKLCTPVDGPTNYALPLNGPELTIQFPRLSAVRLYFSFEQPLQVVVGPNGIPSAPAGWVQDANFSTLFDWIELTWELNASDTTLGANTTQVDMFGLPFNLSLAGSDAEGKPLTVQGGFSDAGLRHQILTALQNAPAPWQQLVLTESQGGLATRAIAPYHGMEMGLFPRTQLDDCIAQVWAKYTTETLTATAEGVTFNGQVVADQLVFTPAAGTGETITFPKPDSFMVYTSGPLPLVDTTKAGVLKAALQAGFLRSTLLISTQLPECDASRYYQAEPVNQYARTLHEYGTNGGAYAFGFDDVCSHSSFIIVHNPQSAQLTLLAF